MQKQAYEFISKQTNDPIIERRTCRRTGEEFPVFDSEIRLLEKLSPIFPLSEGEGSGVRKYPLSLPTLSPKARQIRRMMWRNERRFYKSPSGVSTISPETGLKTVSQSDFFDFDHMSHGVEYSGDFGADMKKIFKAMPYPNRLTNNMENAEYCQQETDDKNCFLNAGGHFNENSMYNTYSLHGIRTVDNYWVFESEHIYESIKIHKSQKIFFSYQIENSFNIRFSKDIKSCQNVLFGFGLNNASYIYKNKVLPKDEREKIFQSYKEKIATSEGLQEIQKEAEQFHAQFPKKAINNLNCEQSTGNDLNNTKHILLSTNGEEAKDIIHTNLFGYINDCMDIESFARGQKCYNFASSMQATDSIVGSQIFENVQNSMYVYFDKNSSFLSGCVGLNHKTYCVLNKQYDKETREKLTIQIIEELQSKGRFGDFFDPEDSPFPYNDSVAMDYYPIDEKQVTILHPEKFISDALLDLGGADHGPAKLGKIKIKRRTRNQEIEIPEHKDIVICKVSGRPFRLAPMEIEFYHKHGLPLPTKHPDIRHAERFAQRPGREFYLITCAKCQKETLSVYKGNNVYCENCYNKEIYG